MVMYVGSINGRMQQWIWVVGKYWYVGVVDDVVEFEGVVDCVLQVDIVGGDGQGDYVMLFIGKGYQQGQGVVYIGIGVD